MFNSLVSHKLSHDCQFWFFWGRLGCDFFERVHMYACAHFNLFRIFRPCVSLCKVLFFGWVSLLSTCPHKMCFFAHVRVCTLENDYRSTCLHVYKLHGCIFSPKNMHVCNMQTCTQIDKGPSVPIPPLLALQFLHTSTSFPTFSLPPHRNHFRVFWLPFCLPKFRQRLFHALEHNVLFTSLCNFPLLVYPPLSECVLFYLARANVYFCVPRLHPGLFLFTQILFQSHVCYFCLPDFLWQYFLITLLFGGHTFYVPLL